MKQTLFAAMLALGLAACGGDREEQAEYVTDAERLAPQPAPAPTPASSDALTPDGWKGLRIGMTREEITAAYGPDANPDAVGGPEPESCDEYRPEDAPDGFLLMLVNEKLARIKLMRGAAVKTDAGLGLGASAEEVKEAYDGEAIVTPHKYVEAPAEYITVWKTGQTGPDYVQDETARGIRYVIDKEGKVQTIQAGGPAIQYVEGCL
ncbi:hypothetical protein [Hyphococcus sp.]|uniref:hypothetical protein n=1 Tax=Hyphococcus sp. TaxID=2038636 RepID=UPI0035C7291E